MKKRIAVAMVSLMGMNMMLGTCPVYAADGVEVSVAVWSGEWGTKIEDMIEHFNGLHEADGVTLSIEMQSGDYSNFLGTCAATGEYPDMFILTPYAQVQQYAENGMIMDLSDCDFVDKVYPNALEAVKYDGKYYGYPANYEWLGVFYNKDLFAQAGIEAVPTTPEEFKDVCQKLTDAGITPIAASYKESWTLKHMMSTLISPFVADDMEGFVNGLNDGSQTFDQPWMDQVFNFVDIIKEYTGTNRMDMDSQSMFTDLATGKAAMAFTGEFGIATNYAMDEPQTIGVFPVPVSEDPEQNILAADVGVVYAVSSKTEHMDEVKMVLDFMSDQEDEGGYFDINNAAPGNAQPAMPYEGGEQWDAKDDYLSYVTEGKSCPWVYQLFVNGFDVTAGDLFQGYFADTTDKDTLIQAWSDAYAEYVEINE